MVKANNKMSIPTRKIFLFLLLSVLVLLALHLYSSALPDAVHKKFNLNGEANIPAWYSTVLLFSVALSSLVI